MLSFRLHILAALVLLPAAASAQPDTARPLVVDGDFGPVTLTLDYEQRRGDLRRATLSILPALQDAPMRQPEQVAVLSRTGQWIMFETFLSSGHTTGFQAEGVAPAPESIVMILIKPQRGPWRGWKVEEGESYTEVEWTYVNQRGREVRSAPCAPRACFANVVDAFNQAESTASSFRVKISGITKSGGGNNI